MRSSIRAVEVYRNTRTGAISVQRLGFDGAGFLTHVDEPVVVPTGSLTEAAVAAARMLMRDDSGTPVVYRPGLSRRQQRELVKGQHVVSVVIDAMGESYTITPMHRKSGGWIARKGERFRGETRDLDDPGRFADQLAHGFEKCT